MGFDPGLLVASGAGGLRAEPPGLRGHGGLRRRHRGAGDELRAAAKFLGKIDARSTRVRST